MTNNNINERTFPLILRRTRTIILKIANFPLSSFLTFLLTINSPNITMIVTQTMRGIINIVIPKIVVTSITHLVNRAILPMILKSPIATFILKIQNRETVNLLFYNHFINIAKLGVRSITSVTSGFNHMVLVAIAAQLRKLSDLDGSILSDLDSNPLSYLDAA